MKSHEEIQFIFNKTLGFITQNIESEEDYKMLKTTMEDYREMGYSTKEFERRYETYLEMLAKVYDGVDLDFNGWFKR